MPQGLRPGFGTRLEAGEPLVCLYTSNTMSKSSTGCALPRSSACRANRLGPFSRAAVQFEPYWKKIAMRGLITGEDLSSLHFLNEELTDLFDPQLLQRNIANRRGEAWQLNVICLDWKDIFVAPLLEHAFLSAPPLVNSPCAVVVFI